MDNETVIAFDDVSYSYDTMRVVESARFEIHRRESVCLVGPNGGGKSTILKLILGLLAPGSGKITVFGTTPVKARTRIGYMPQFLEFDHQFPVIAMDIVLMGRLSNKIFGFYSKSDRKKAIIALEKMGVADLANRQFAALSGGERQRVLIARALACEPELLLLDEPTANVDPAIEAQFYEILKTLVKEMTIVTVSHDLGFVSQIVNHVVCVNRSVRVHPTSELDGNLIKEIYGADLQIVRHDHSCASAGHPADHHGQSRCCGRSGRYQN